MQSVLSTVHGLDYLFFHFLLGATVFRWAIVPAGGLDAERADPAWIYRWKALVWLTFAASLLWMVMTSADMVESWLPQDLWQAVAHTAFGHLWCVRVLVLLALATSSSFFARSPSRLFIYTVTLSGVALISSLSGHAASQESGTWWRVPLDLVHSLAAGIWSGGLLSLYVWLGTRTGESIRGGHLSQTVVNRFSHVAMGSTALLFFTGLGMAWGAGVSFVRPWSDTYGQLLIGKTLLFSVALAAASINQFIHMRRPAATEAIFAGNLRREVRLEVACVAVVFLIAGFLARTQFPSDLAM